MLDTDLAYMAGAMDSDGYFTIKKSTYRKRVKGDTNNATYSEKIGLHQVTPIVPELLQSSFGGCCALAKPQRPNSKAMYRWTATDRNAASACVQLLPYLRIKKAQAERLLELRKTKNGGYGQVSYWFSQEYPDWPQMELLTTKEVISLIGYSGKGMVSQAIRNGTLLALPYNHNAVEKPRIPKLLVERLVEHKSHSRDNRGINQPPELIQWRDRLWGEVRELNKIGVNGTPIYHRTGCYTPAE